MTDQQEALLLAVLDHPQHAEQIVEWASEPGNLALLEDEPASPKEPPKQLAHAPAGGVTVQGRQFRGGEFIPGDVIDKATPEEKAAVDGKGGDSKPAPSIPGLSPEAQRPENVGKVRQVMSAVKSAAKVAIGRLSLLTSKHAPDVLLEAADFCKITFSAPGSTADPVKGAMGISANDAALIASHVLGRAALWAKRKLTNNPNARLSHEDAPDVEALADVLLELLGYIGSAIGSNAELPEREAVVAKLTKRIGSGKPSQ